MIATTVSRTQKVLKTMKNGDQWTTLRLSEAMGIDLKEAYNSISNLRNAGCVSAEGRPGGKTGFSSYTITQKGLDRLKRWDAVEAAREMRFVAPKPMVTKTIRSIPNSVFALGALHG